MELFKKNVRAIAEKQGLLTGDEERDRRVLNRLYNHFLMVAA